MADNTPQFEIEADRIMWDMIAQESSLSESEKTKYQELLFNKDEGNQGLVLVDPDNSGNFMFLTNQDVGEIIRRDRAGGDQEVWLHSSYGGNLKISLSELKRTKFSESVDSEGESLEFSSSTYLAARVFGRFKIEAGAPVAEGSHVEEDRPEDSKKKEKTEKSELVKQIEADKSLTEEEKTTLIAMAEEGNLVYVDIGGTPQYLAREHVQYLIEQGNDPDLEVEVLMTQDGSNQGSKVALKDLLDVLERADAFETATTAKEDQPAEQPQDKKIPTEDQEEGLLDQELPGTAPLPEDFIPPASLEALSDSLPKISGLLPGGGNVNVEHEVDTTVSGPDAVRLIDKRPHQVLTEGPPSEQEEGSTEFSFEGVKAPEMPRSGAPGQKQQPSADPKKNMPADEQALKDASKKKQEEVDKQLQEGAEEEEKNKGRYQGESSGKNGKKKFWTANKIGALGVGGAGTLTAGAMGASYAGAHTDTVISLISIFV